MRTVHVDLTGIDPGLAFSLARWRMSLEIAAELRSIEADLRRQGMHPEDVEDAVGFAQIGLEAQMDDMMDELGRWLVERLH